VRQLTVTEKAIVQSLLSEIFNNESIAKPVYCPEVQSEADARSMAESLPLIYIWNEDRNRGSFSISVNGRVVGSILERKVNRSSPSFGPIRDEVMQVLQQATQGSVVSACERIGALPSVVFARVSMDQVFKNAMRALLADKALSLPLYAETMKSRDELDSNWQVFPLVVIWGARDAGEKLDMTISVNHKRLEDELLRVAPSLQQSGQWDELMDVAQKGVGKYANGMLSDLVAAGLPVPLGLSAEARASLLNS
jgi:hypothetical protein